MNRRRRPPGYAFYTTALVVSLFAVYRLLRPIVDIQDERNARAPLVSRSLQTRDEECRYVHNSHDRCAYVRANCPDEEAGLISYLQLYYCSLANAQPVAFAILVLWISLLFSTIGIAASDFLCINLSTIASVLGMSESLTGVTFLAFGNGSPDVFSTFAAMSSHSGSLAVGELMGAAGFITAVVAGSMALVKPFQVARKSFVRDVGFFAVAASFSMVFLADGSLRLWECASMIGFYVFYVVFVVTWHWWLSRRRRRRLRENAARLHLDIPRTQELEAPELDDDEDGRPVGRRASLPRVSSAEDYSANDYLGHNFSALEEAGTPAWKLEEIDDDDEQRDRYLAELRSRMRVSRPGRGERRNTITPIRPSLIGALEFRAVLSSLEKKSTTGSNTNINLRRYSDDPSFTLAQAMESQPLTSQPDLVTQHPHLAINDDGLPPNSGNGGRNRAVSANDAVGLRLDTHFLNIPGQIPETAVSSEGTSPSTNPTDHGRGSYGTSNTRSLSPPARSPQFVVSPPIATYSSDVQQGPQQIDAGRLTPFHRPNYDDPDQGYESDTAVSPMMRGLKVPRLQLPVPDHSKPLLGSPFPSYMESPGQMTPSHSRASSIRLPAPSLSPESVPNTMQAEYEDGEDEIRRYSWWPYAYAPTPQTILSTLFPTLYGWRSKSIWDKLLGAATAPSVFLLTITLPVVEGGEDEDIPDPDPGFLTPSAGPQPRSGTQLHLPPDSPSSPPRPSAVDAPPHPHKMASARQMSDYHFPESPNDRSQGVSGPKEWNRWLVILQIFTAPLFVVLIVWANMDEDHNMKFLLLLIFGSLAFSLSCLLIILAATAPDREPRYRPLFCFLGFAVAVAWISTIANEVVGVLKAFGVILGISDAILGLTIFAVGNSLGDLVADITVARLGFPVMALSACFGGPMLNILLGIGISGMYMTLQKSEKSHHKHPHRPMKYKPFEIEVSTTLMISGITLLVTLVGLLIVVPLNGWRMDRKIGWGLITLWSLSTIGNVVVEILGYGGELDLGF